MVNPTIPPALAMVIATCTASVQVPTREAESTTPGSPGNPGQDAIVRAIVTVSGRRRRQADVGANPTADADDVCPYPGLRSFGTEDAAWFHGRNAEITELLVRLTQLSASSGPLVAHPAQAGPRCCGPVSSPHWTKHRCRGHGS